MPPLTGAALLGLGGGVFGFAADRLAARWPREGASRRPVDWRTALIVVVAITAYAGLALRWSEPRDLLLLAAYFAALVVLMATDLDQKLLPDVITLPLIPAALLLLLVGWHPLLDGRELAVASALAGGITAPAVLLVTNLVLHGGLGVGDLKLAVSLGLMSGLGRLVGGFVIASALSSVVLLALLGSRRIRLRSTIPLGPVLIAGGFVAALLP